MSKNTPNVAVSTEVGAPGVELDLDAVVRQHAEQQYAEELAELAKVDTRPAPTELEAFTLGGEDLSAGRQAGERLRDHAQIYRQRPSDRDRHRHPGHRPGAAALRRARHRQVAGSASISPRPSPATPRCSSRARRAPTRAPSATAGTTPGCWPKGHRRDALVASPMMRAMRDGQALPASRS